MRILRVRCSLPWGSKSRVPPCTSRRMFCSSPLPSLRISWKLASVNLQQKAEFCPLLRYQKMSAAYMNQKAKQSQIFLNQLLTARTMVMLTTSLFARPYWCFKSLSANRSSAARLVTAERQPIVRLRVTSLYASSPTRAKTPPTMTWSTMFSLTLKHAVDALVSIIANTFCASRVQRAMSSGD